MSQETDNIPDEVKEEPLTIFQITMMVLSVYVLIALFVQYMFPLTPEMDGLIDKIDFFICLIFLGDFFYRFYHAPSKARFMRWGWIDFVSSIPMLPTRGGRMFRIVKIFRLLRAFRSVRLLLTYLMRNRTQNTFVTVASGTCLLAMVSSMMILNIEKDEANANIKTPSDALWWSVVTVTTVGYGDKYPVTDAGRVVAAILMTAGVGLFGTFTGFIASMFVEPDIKREEDQVQNLVKEIRALRAEVQSMDEKVTRTNRSLKREQKRKRERNAGTNPPAAPDSPAAPDKSGPSS